MSDNPEMIYTDEDVDLKPLVDAYESALTDLNEYFETCRTSYNDRRNLWSGKTNDLRKSGANAFPWAGASDNEVNVCGERLDTYVALFDQALQRSHIKAFATSAATLPKAAVVSAFLKWMRSTFIPDFKGQMELGGNYLLEKGLMVTYVGWKRELRTYRQTITLDEIAAQSPELAAIILQGQDEGALVDMLKQTFPAMNTQRGKKVLRELRKSGQTEIPVPRVSVDCPVVHACAPDGEVIMPPYVTDPQRSPYIFWRTFMTAQELEKKVTAEGWRREWVDEAIAKLRGVDSDKIDGQRMQSTSRLGIQDDSDLVMVIHGYQRLIEEEDGSEGIYCTVFNPALDTPAKHELLNGYDDYPFVFTRLSQDQKRIYETQPMTKALRGPQMQIKTERDSRVDRASIATLPPMMHPAGRPPSDWGPGRRVPYRRLGEIAFGPVPPLDSGSMEVELQMRQQADRAVGLDAESPHSLPRQQYYVGKFLDHVRDVLGLAWKLFQRMGPEEVFFQVSGNADPQIIQRGSPDDNFTIVVEFDSRMMDPENATEQVKQMGGLMQYDRNGRIDPDKLIELAANAISPVLADYILQPQEVAQEKMTKDVTDDLTKIAAAIEVPARPNGAQIALQIVQAYAQQPDVAQRLQTDEAFAERLTKYAGQYQFMMQQAQNAEIGKLGTAPAQVGGVNTQSVNQ